MSHSSVLVVDDDASAAEYMALALERAGYVTRKAEDAFEALRHIAKDRPGLVVSDLQMPGMSGLELLECIQQRWPHIPFMLVTVEQDVATVVSAMQRGAINYLIKPVSPATLLAATEKALSRQHGSRGQPNDTAMSDIIGATEGIKQVRQCIAMAARSDANVLVVGETGTGKELVARAIHRLSCEPSGPFIAHNCATTPPDMFDAEFFGHLRGSFTGAHRDRAGLLRDAHGGTLLLDELECLSLVNQAKLLRVLDDGEVRAVGSDKAVLVAVRFISATNRPPDAMLVAGELREDLYYRLRGFEIRLPPLRERLEDISLLAEYFLQGSDKQLSHAAIEALKRCVWPGNVRQLRMTLKTAAAHTAERSIDVAHLNLDIPGGVGGPSAAPPSSWQMNSGQQTAETLVELERDAIARALAAHGGNRTEAARSLGIHRTTLVRRLRELGIVHSDKTK